MLFPCWTGIRRSFYRVPVSDLNSAHHAPLPDAAVLQVGPLKPSLADTLRTRYGAAVLPDDAAARGGELKGDVAGAAREVENIGVDRRGNPRDEAPLPPLVETARQQHRDQVVAVCNRGEQRADELAFAVRGGEPFLPLHFAKRILPDIIAECGVQE